MTYRVRMSAEVRDWLSTLVAQDHEKGRAIGEAVAVLFECDAETGAPLVVPLQSALRTQSPGSALDYCYRRLLQLLQRIRRDVADMAAARKRLGLQISRAGHEQNARVARRRYEELVREEERAALQSQRLQAKVDAFRVRKEVVKANYTAAQARQEIDKAFAAAGEPSMSERAVDDMTAVHAAISELLQVADDLQRQLSDDAANEGTSELRLESADLRLLFAAESPDTAVLLVVGMGQDWGAWYDEALPLAQAERELAGDDFTDYDLATFLSEYFPGEETEVRAGAFRLIELNRAQEIGPTGADGLP
ncbi:hypothetical protein Pth03_39080 [Planotetraspora thailandica]|uniref:Uncharacterized protein n=1 Tax=Planotetraspora thailandica TaxID=487172 RepID=A0A8J3XWM8_9ACTN|nr:hypothetical protein [Planotetraspora thailandica]GII55519.1 hypothetical protein Pth03_39080 [Planotetraspora thailandica]